MLKKTLLAVATTTLLSTAAFNASAIDQGHGIVNFSGTVITAPCSVAPESSQIDVNLGQVADTVLNGGQYSQSADFTIQLRDCVLTSTDTEGKTTTINKVNVTFTSANVDVSDTSLMSNTKETTTAAQLTLACVSWMQVTTPLLWAPQFRSWVMPPISRTYTFQ